MQRKVPWRNDRVAPSIDAKKKSLKASRSSWGRRFFFMIQWETQSKKQWPARITANFHVDITVFLGYHRDIMGINWHHADINTSMGMENIPVYPIGHV